MVLITGAMMELTDILIAEVYASFVQHYKELKDQGLSDELISKIIDANLEGSFCTNQFEWDSWCKANLNEEKERKEDKEEKDKKDEKPQFRRTLLSYLDKDSKNTIHRISRLVKDSFVSASNGGKLINKVKIKEQDQQSEKTELETKTSDSQDEVIGEGETNKPQQSVKIAINHYQVYCYHENNTLPTWFVISDIFSHIYCMQSAVIVSGPAVPLPHTKDFDGDALKVLLLIAVALIVAIVTLVALCYVFSEFLNLMERLIYNEGCIQALINLSSMIIAATGAVLFDVYVGSIALTAVAAFFGFSNPVGFIIVGAICGSIITAAITAYIVNNIQTPILESSNVGALDPSDPRRFSLSKREEAALEKKGLDPIAVKCAIIEKKREIEKVSYFLKRFCNNEKEQEVLQTIRDLKRGKYEYIDLPNGRTLNLMADAAKYEKPSYYLPASSPEEQRYPDAMYPTLGSVIEPNAPAYVS